MGSAGTDPKILRSVARSAMADARAELAALERLGDSATDESLRAAYRACVFAARALRRASVDASARDEKAMIEASILFDEQGYGLRRRIISSATASPILPTGL